MKRRRQPVSPWSLGSIPVTPIENKSGYETREEFVAREAAEAEAVRTAPIRRVQNEFNETLRQQQARVRRFFSLPLGEMSEFPVSAAPIDPIGDYPERGDSTPDSERAAFYELYERLKALGVTLTEDGWVRLGKGAAALGFHRNVALTPETLLRMLQRLHYELDVFAPGEITGTVPQPVVAPSQAPPPQETAEQRRHRLDTDLETVSAVSREGRQQILGYLGQMFGYDVQRMFYEFVDHMENKFGVDINTDRVKQALGDWATRWNKNLLAPKSYDEFRREVLDKSGWFALSLLTKDEKLAESVEHSNFDDLSVRQNFARRSRELNAAAKS